MWIVRHEEIAADTKVASGPTHPRQVDANTEGGRKVIGRWNRPTNFDHLTGDLLDMSTSRQWHTWIWTMDLHSTPPITTEGAQKPFGSRLVSASRRPEFNDLPAELPKPTSNRPQGIRKSFGSRSGGTQGVAKPLVFVGGSENTRGQSK